MKYFIVFILLIFLINSCSPYKFIGMMNDIEKWEKFVLKEVSYELENIVKKKCPTSNIENFKKFYKHELKLFPIRFSFETIKDLSKQFELKNQLDTLVLVLSYPMVGFDPEEGYSTDLFVIKKEEKQVLLEYSETKKKFEALNTKLKPSDILKNYDKMESGCDYGYYIVTYLTPRLEAIRCKIILGYSLQPRD